DHDVERKVLAAPVQIGDLIRAAEKGLKQLYRVQDLTPFMEMGQKFDFKAKSEKYGTTYFGNFIDYGKEYNKVSEDLEPMEDEEIAKLNKERETKFRDKWHSYEDARKVMNYRRSGFTINVDENYQWEHTVEQSAGGIFSSHQINTL